MASRSAALLLLVATTAICAAVLVPRAEARLDTGTARFSSCGGAESCLGKARLRRILKRSHWHHRKSAEELAQQLDKDGDLVRSLFLAAVSLQECCQSLVP